MQTLSQTDTTHSESTVYRDIAGQPGTDISFPSEPLITITENALRYISEMRERLGLPVKGVRVVATPRSPLRADFAIRFVPAEEAVSPTTFIQSLDNLDIYIDPESAPYLEDATIDFEFTLVSSELKVVAPLRKLDTTDGRIAAKIHQVLAEQVNPSLAMHGGAAVLIDVIDGIAFLELTGGCQGCSMANNTLKGNIEITIRHCVPEVKEVRDITKHANGMNPYFL